MFDNDDWMNFQFGNGVRDLSNFDDEMDDIQSALNEEEPNGGTFKSTVSEIFLILKEKCILHGPEGLYQELLSHLS
jgi:hypothetical protein